MQCSRIMTSHPKTRYHIIKPSINKMFVNRCNESRRPLFSLSWQVSTKCCSGDPSWLTPEHRQWMCCKIVMQAGQHKCTSINLTKSSSLTCSMQCMLQNRTITATSDLFRYIRKKSNNSNNGDHSQGNYTKTHVSLACTCNYRTVYYIDSTKKFWIYSFGINLDNCYTIIYSIIM